MKTTQTKHCTKCQTDRELTEFYRNKSSKDGLQQYCKPCKKAQNDSWRKRNPAYNEKWHEKNPSYRKEWREANKESLASYSKEWRGANKEHINTYARSRRANDPAMRWVHNTRTKLHRILHSAGSHPETLELLGCTGQEWRDHLESQFTDGMSWDNYGKGDSKWGIDHIIPVSSFDQSDPEQRAICWHFSNTQPLWHIENVLKGNSIPTE